MIYQMPWWVWIVVVVAIAFAIGTIAILFIYGID